MHSEVSGDWVDVSGATVIAKISGETVVTSISGQTVVTEISGQTVVAEISGQTVVAEVSGQVVVTSVSGDWVNVSGATVISLVSGQTVVAEISGQTVVTSISGQTVVTSVSGESVFVYISGGSIATAPSIVPVWTTATSSGVLDLTTPAAQEAYLDYVEYHGASACTVSSAGAEFTVDHNTVEGYVFNVFAVDMGVNTVKDLVYYPDTPTVLVSGDYVQVAFQNPEAVSCYVRLMTRR